MGIRQNQQMEILFIFKLSSYLYQEFIEFNRILFLKTIQQNSQVMIFQHRQFSETLTIPLQDLLLSAKLTIPVIATQKLTCLFLQSSFVVCYDTVSSEKYFVIPMEFDLKFSVHYSRDQNLELPNVVLSKKGNEDLFMRLTTDQITNQKILSYFKTMLIHKGGFHETYKPIRKIGTGSFATVFEVQRIQDKKKFAVKAFSKNHVLTNQKNKKSLINELDVLRFLNHRNVMKMEAVYQSQNSIYVLMQLIHGNHFLKVAKENGNLRFTPNQIEKFMKNLLEGLEHLHMNRIMHRDLKPENIMLKNGKLQNPIIVDFGLGTNCDLEEYLFYRCGTPGYIAPEILALKTNNTHIEPVCDIFSSGAIFHLLLTQRPLFEGNQFEEVYQNNKKMQFQIDAQQIEEKSRNSYAFDLLIRMLEKDPENRITANQALNHPYFNNIKVASPSATVDEEGI